MVNARPQGRSGPPAQPGQQGGLPFLQTQVQALEQKVTDLSTALSDLSKKVAVQDAGLEKKIADVSAQLVGFQQLLDEFNQRWSGAARISPTSMMSTTPTIGGLPQAVGSPP